MAAQVIHYRFRLRRATAARWTSTNDLLYQGEIGVETDTNFMKLGDGTTPWNNLSYWNGAPITGFSNIADGQVLAWDATNSQWVPADAGKKYAAGSGINITNPNTSSPTINSTLGSIALSGRVSAYSNLPTGLTTSDAGKAYLNDGDGLIYVWDGSAFPASGSGVTSSGVGDYTGQTSRVTSGNVQIPSYATQYVTAYINGKNLAIPAYEIVAPSVVSGYTLRLKAADIIVASGQPVSTWTAEAGASASQSNTSYQPTLISSAINGHPAVRFDGSSTYLKGSTIGVSGQAAFTVFIVSQRNSLASNNYCRAFAFGDTTVGTGGASIGCAVDSNYSSGGNGSGYRYNNGNLLFNNILGTTPDIRTWRMNSTDTYSSAQLFVNDVKQTGASPANGSGTTNLTDGGFLIGAGMVASGSIGDYANVDIAEILFYDRALTDSEVTSVNAALKQQYGV